MNCLLLLKNIYTDMFNIHYYFLLLVPTLQSHCRPINYAEILVQKMGILKKKMNFELVYFQMSICYINIIPIITFLCKTY